MGCVRLCNVRFRSPLHGIGRSRHLHASSRSLLNLVLLELYCLSAHHVSRLERASQWVIDFQDSTGRHLVIEQSGHADDFMAFQAEVCHPESKDRYN